MNYQNTLGILESKLKNTIKENLFKEGMEQRRDIEKIREKMENC
jgi:hypothetical protein